jgi:hypothetical protein
MPDVPEPAGAEPSNVRETAAALTAWLDGAAAGT